MKLKVRGRVIEIPDGVNSKIGIDNLKEGFSFVAEMMEKIAKYKEDGKFSGWEIAKTIFYGLTGLKLVPHFEKMLEESEDLSAEEEAEIVSYISEEFNWDEAEASKFFHDKIKIAMHLIFMIFELIQSVKPLVKKRK